MRRLCSAKGGGFLYRLLVDLIEAISRLLAVERLDVSALCYHKNILPCLFSCPPALDGVDSYGQPCHLVDETTVISFSSFF